MTRKIKVAVIEDEDNLRSALETKLKLSGYSVLLARDGEEGLSVCRAEHPDIILLDLIMPRMSGGEFLQKLRGDFWGKDAKVICLTNRDLDGDISEMLERYHPMYYLVKAENSLEEVMERIKGCFPGN
jgi:DNA-binding response OmpR family regulator